MKNFLILLFAATAAGLGVVCVSQWRQTAQTHAELSEARTRLQQQEEKLTAAQAGQQASETEKRELQMTAAQLAAQVGAMRAESKSAPTGSASSTADAGQKASPGKSGFGDMFSNMFKDPEMKKFLRQQQRGMVDQLYGPLVKKMGMTTEEGEAFKDLLADRMMQGVEKAGSLFGNSSVAERGEALKNMAAEQKNQEEEIRAYLGESKYALYQQYQDTVGERTQLMLFQQQNAAGGEPLSEAQTDQLLSLMRDERQNAAAAKGVNMPSANDAETMSKMLSEGQTDKLLEAQALANQRVFERAREVLSSGQLDSFGKFQTNQLQMMRMGFGMARKLFGTEQDQALTPTP